VVLWLLLIPEFHVELIGTFCQKGEEFGMAASKDVLRLCWCTPRLQKVNELLRLLKFVAYIQVDNRGLSQCNSVVKFCWYIAVGTEMHLLQLTRWVRQEEGIFDNNRRRHFQSALELMQLCALRKL
jgi:hypothetical protein